MKKTLLTTAILASFAAPAFAEVAIDRTDDIEQIKIIGTKTDSRGHCRLKRRYRRRANAN